LVVRDSAAGEWLCCCSRYRTVSW